MAIPDKPIKTSSGLTLEFIKLSPERAKLQAEAQKQAQHNYVLTHIFKERPGTTMADVFASLGHTLYNVLRTVHLSGDPNTDGVSDNNTTGGLQLYWHADKNLGRVTTGAKGGK